MDNLIRLIARVDARNGFHIKTINCEGVQKLRTIEESINLYSEGENVHDEILLIDSVASLYGFKNWLLRTQNNYYYCPIPLSIGGAISSPKDALETLQKGADKIVVNTAAINNPNLLEQISNVCGRQAVILQIDAKFINDKYMCFTHGTRELSSFSVKDWISCSHSNGVGEIHLTSIDSEGTSNEFPEDLISLSISSTDLPIIISGGIRSSEQISKINKKFGIDSFSMSSLTNICNRNLHSVREDLIKLGHIVRDI